MQSDCILSTSRDQLDDSDLHDPIPGAPILLVYRMEEGRKRERGTPTGRTPEQKAKRPSSSAKKKLAFPTTPSRSPLSAWSLSEEKALVEFILLTHPHEWPVSMKSEYWERAAKFVYDHCGTEA